MLACAALMSGCVNPILHPVRAPEGPYLRAGVGVGISGGDRVVCRSQCAQQRDGVATTASAAMAVGLGHRISPRLGVLAGLTIAAPTLSPIDDRGQPDALDFAALDLWTDWTTPRWFVAPLTMGAGVSVSLHTITPEIALRGRFFGISARDGVSLWARAPVPWPQRDDTTTPLVRPAQLDAKGTVSGGDVLDTALLGGRAPMLQVGLSAHRGALGLHLTLLRRWDGGLMEVSFLGPERDHVRWLSVLAVSVDLAGWE